MSHRLFIVVVLAALLFPALPQTALAGRLGASLQDALATSGPGQSLNVIVTMRDKADIKRVSRQMRAARRAKRRAAVIRELRRTLAKPGAANLRQMARGFGAKNLKNLWLTGSVALSANEPLIYWLASRPEVDAVLLDQDVTLPPGSSLPALDVEPNLVQVGAPLMWQRGYTGSGIVVAVVDSGADLDHPDLQQNWRGGSNSWLDLTGTCSTPCDTLGHGTAVTSLIAGRDTGGSVIGVAPDAQWIAARAFDASGTASYSDILLAFQWVMDPDGNPDTDDAADIVNNSWGMLDTLNTCDEFLAQAVDTMRQAGIAVVFSAGNSGPGTDLSPANLPGAFSVGSVDSAGQVSSFSSRGTSSCDGRPYPSVYAPGEYVRAADLSFGGLALYVDAEGSSFAAPHASGVMALLLNALGGAFGGMDASTLETALTATAGQAQEEDGTAAQSGVIHAHRAFSMLASSGACQGDINLDGTVSLMDLLTLRADLGTTGCSENGCPSDLNNDGAVTMTDFLILRSSLGQTNCIHTLD